MSIFCFVNTPTTTNMLSFPYLVGRTMIKSMDVPQTIFGREYEGVVGDPEEELSQTSVFNTYHIQPPIFRYEGSFPSKGRIG